MATLKAVRLPELDLSRGRQGAPRSLRARHRAKGDIGDKTEGVLLFLRDKGLRIVRVLALVLLEDERVLAPKSVNSRARLRRKLDAVGRAWISDPAIAILRAALHIIDRICLDHRHIRRLRRPVRRRDDDHGRGRAEKQKFCLRTHETPPMPKFW